MDLSSHPSLSGQKRRAAISSKYDEKGNDINPSGNHQSGFSTSSADNEKEALITELQIGYQSLVNLRLDAATWQKHVDIRKGMNVDQASRAWEATIQATMNILKSQNQAKTPGQRLLEKMPPLPDPLDETWRAPFNGIKCASTVDEMQRAMMTVGKLTGDLQEEVWRLEEENIRL